MDQLPRGAEEPKISRVTDLGDVRTLPRSGVMPTPDSDDRFALGELIFIEGSNFGRLPAVRIGGESVRILARTNDGGIVCRIPGRIDSGTIEIVVSHEAGRDATSIGVERNAVLVDRSNGKVHFLVLGRGSESDVRGTIRVPGAFDARISPDGQAAYVVSNPAGSAQTAAVHVIALTSAGGPRQLRALHLDLPQVSAFGVAEKARLGAVVGRGRMVLLDLRKPLQPRALPPFPLVVEAHALAIHPEGRKIALLSPRDNILTTVDVASRNMPRVEAAVDLVPGDRDPMAVDVEFAPGGAVWALLGDGPSVSDGGARPTRLAKVSWETGRPRLERTVELLEATGAPVALALGRRIPSTRRPMPIIVATVNRKLYSNEPGSVPSRLDDLGQILATDQRGRTRVLSRQTAVFGDPEVSHDMAWAVSPTIRLLRGEGGTRFELGLSFDPIAGSRAGRSRFVKLGNGRPSGLKRPPVFGIAP
ncbi:MAG TPA: IPT/TIG domain-containing protein [Kofleriaceae bacterium]|nr:IPT/TIG domain-containing protein [Kofleriaceae bacterium]